MTTPFDAVVEGISARRFHNHRLDEHSDTVSAGLYNDLLAHCDVFESDVKTGLIKKWLNVRAPGARERKIDLLIGEQQNAGIPDLTRIRIAVENKSVITAHRNRDARFDDLNETLQVIHRVKPETIIVATILIGVASRVLNIPDSVKKTYKNKVADFNRNVLPRLSSGDQALWDEFSYAVSMNRPGDALKTIQKFRDLPTREPAQTHKIGYDYILLVPVMIDNVNPPMLPAVNNLGVELDSHYQEMLDTICAAYGARWHPRSLTRRR